MTIAEFAKDRGIREIVHFTQQRGLLGISITQTVLPRSELPHEQLLEYIIKLNAAKRTDKAWFGHVNLSINNINRRFFDQSATWHKETKKIWWAILSFDPCILSHDNVYFATTNNGYEAGVERELGLEGLQALYGEPIDHGFPTWPQHRRKASAPKEDPTCPQAEVLYPGRLSTSHLRRVYVRDDATYREACSFLTFLPNRKDIEVSVEPDRFSPFRIDPCKAPTR